MADKPNKWMQDLKLAKGSLREKLGIKEGETISDAKLDSTIAGLKKEGEGDKKLSAEKRKLSRQAVLARTFKRAKRAKASQ
mgnify:CR=1 FL=1